MAKLSEIGQLKLELRRKKVELEILKNTRNWKWSVASSSCKICERIERLIYRTFNCSCLNAPIESFHSSLKCEVFYIKDEVLTSSSIAIQIVENYIPYYNEKQNRQKLDYLSPVEYSRPYPRMFLLKFPLLRSVLNSSSFFVYNKGFLDRLSSFFNKNEV